MTKRGMYLTGTPQGGTDDQARRDRVRKAIATTCTDWSFPTAGIMFDKVAEAAIAAYENEPEPTPRLLEEMARAMFDTDAADAGFNNYMRHARAALGVVCKQLSRNTGPKSIGVLLGIPESLVKDLIDGE